MIFTCIIHSKMIKITERKAKINKGPSEKKNKGDKKSFEKYGPTVVMNVRPFCNVSMSSEPNSESCKTHREIKQLCLPTSNNNNDKRHNNITMILHLMFKNKKKYYNFIKAYSVVKIITCSQGSSRNFEVERGKLSGCSMCILFILLKYPSWPCRIQPLLYFELYCAAVGQEE